MRDSIHQRAGERRPKLCTECGRKLGRGNRTGLCRRCYRALPIDVKTAGDAAAAELAARLRRLDARRLGAVLASLAPDRLAAALEHAQAPTAGPAGA